MIAGDPGGSEPLFLGVECGATRTVAILADARLRLRQRLEAGPANLRLLGDGQLVRHFKTLALGFPRPSALSIGMAGAREARDRARLGRLAGRVWRGVPCQAANDLETALATAQAASGPARVTRVIVLSGTGSCCYGRTPEGQTAKVGGWGHLLGDKGSGYEIGLRALKAVVYYLDRDGVWAPLGQQLLRTLQLNRPDELIDWAQRADKGRIAALAVEVFRGWTRRDPIAADVLEGAAHTLAQDAVACARRLVGQRVAVDFVLAGGVLLKQPRFAALVARRIRAAWPGARVRRLPREGAWGAVWLAREHFAKAGLGHAAAGARRRAQAQTGSARRITRPDAGSEAPSPARVSPVDLAQSPTEQRNPRSTNLDELALSKAILLMLREEAGVARAVLAERGRIERVIRLVVRAFRRGGRLFYVGAGTSGRLGVLDASECPPTFRAPPDLVQGIIAGGQPALWQSVEGAEDDPAGGADAVRFRGVNSRDVVVGIAASGRTPFVWGALGEARRRGAATVLVTCNPGLRIPRVLRPAVVVAPAVGPEVLTGSTRLKAGTATKLILNAVTTLAMVRLGKVVGNLMVDLDPRNSKLRSRAVRIVRALTGVDAANAQAALHASRWVIRSAVRRLARRGGAGRARSREGLAAVF